MRMTKHESLTKIFKLKWSKKVIYSLETGDKSFSELQINNISSRALSFTLKVLVKRKIVSRKVKEDRTTSYSLTDLGFKIAKIFHELNSVGENSER